MPNSQIHITSQQSQLRNTCNSSPQKRKGKESWRYKKPEIAISRFDRTFGSFFDRQWPGRHYVYTAAPFDLYENDGKYFLEIAAPGFEPKEINVEVSGSTVTVTGRHVEGLEELGVRYFCRKLQRGSLSRTVTLPQDLDSDNGVLKIQLTPIKSISQKRIAVKSA